jgi:hypothetical protein
VARHLQAGFIKNISGSYGRVPREVGIRVVHQRARRPVPQRRDRPRSAFPSLRAAHFRAQDRKQTYSLVKKPRKSKLHPLTRRTSGALQGTHGHFSCRGEELFLARAGKSLPLRAIARTGRDPSPQAKWCPSQVVQTRRFVERLDGRRCSHSRM